MPPESAMRPRRELIALLSGVSGRRNGRPFLRLPFCDPSPRLDWTLHIVVFYGCWKRLHQSLGPLRTKGNPDVINAL